MHALHNIHDTLRDGAVIVDTQPISAHPSVALDGRALGALDMREWAQTIEAVDSVTAEVIADGLFAVDHEEHYRVADTWDDGLECLKTVSSWAGTFVPPELADQIRRAQGTLTVAEDIRLRVLRCTRLKGV